MNPFRTLGVALADLSIAIRNAFYAILDAWIETIPIDPGPEDTIDLTPEEWAEIQAMLASQD